MEFFITKDEIGKGSIALVCDENEYPGVLRAAGYVAGDFEKVFGVRPKECRIHGREESREAGRIPEQVKKSILFGSLGKSGLPERIAEESGIDLSGIRGKRECFRIAAGKMGDREILLIAGSDKRGTIYGLFHFSECLGVAPLTNWLSLTPKSRERFVFTEEMEVTSKEPSVKYRGFFINDEWPAFGTWVNKRFGGFNAAAYEGIFELLLRLKGNYLWPAMWSARFSEDGPGLLSAQLADELGVVMGTSHHEPCLRHGEEYKYLRGRDSVYGDAWDFRVNREGIIRFWEDGLLRSGGFENVITVGMRGEADSTILGENATLADNIDLLRDVIRTQNGLIRKNVCGDLSRVPRMLALYKEVEPFFYGDEKTKGLMDDPELDGVTLMLCDDNYGNLRTLPDEAMRSHPGGYGMYYHLDYHGEPVSYEWVNSSSLTKIREEMTTAYEFGIREIWIVNVGDIFTQEYPLSFFLDLAYDINRWKIAGPDLPAAYTEDYTEHFTKQYFGAFLPEEKTKRIAGLFTDYTHIAHNRRPEAVREKVYAPMAYRERERLTADCERIEAELEDLKASCPPEAYPAFYQLLYYPAMANINVHQLWLAVTCDHFLASIGAGMTNEAAKQAENRLAKDKELVEELHSFMDGKWFGMGLSEHIGFCNWNAEERKNPVLCTLEPCKRGELICVVPETGAYTRGGDWTGKELILPDFLRYEAGTAQLYLYNAGKESADFTVETEGDLLQVTPAEGTVKGCGMEVLRIRPADRQAKQLSEDCPVIRIRTGDCLIRVSVPLPLLDAADDGMQKSQWNAFVMADGYLCMDAADYAEKTDTEAGEFVLLPGFGKTGSGLKAFPVTGTFTPGKDSPCLAYDFYAPVAEDLILTVITAPTNPPFRDNRILFGFSVNEEKIRIVDLIPEGYRVSNDNEDWRRMALCNSRSADIPFSCRKGMNRIRIYAMSPCFIPERLIIRQPETALPYSYFGPAPTRRI